MIGLSAPVWLLAYLMGGGIRPVGSTTGVGGAANLSGRLRNVTLEMVGAILRIARLQLIAKRRRSVGLAVLVGLAAGVAMGAAAGARRTESAFSRMLKRYPGPDVIIPNVPDPSGGTAVFDVGTVRSIPGVRTVAESKPLVSLIHGQPTVSVAHVDAALGGPGLLPYKILSGRQPDPERLDEVIANYVAAQRLGLHVGDVVPLELVAPFTELLTQSGVALPSTVRIVGLYAGPSEIFSEEQTVPALHFSPAVARLFPPFVSSSLLVALDGGPAAVPAFLSELESRAGGKRVQVSQAHQADRDKQQAIHTEAVAVWLLAVLLAATAMLIVGQALFRDAASDAEEDRVLVALGMTRRQLWAKMMLRGLLVLVVGAAAAVGIMYLMSPLLPVGVARLADPHTGFMLDGWVAWRGATVTVVAVIAAIALPMYWLSGRSGMRVRARPREWSLGRRPAPSRYQRELKGALRAHARRGARLRPPEGPGLTPGAHDHREHGSRRGRFERRAGVRVELDTPPGYAPALRADLGRGAEQLFGRRPFRIRAVARRPSRRRSRVRGHRGQLPDRRSRTRR